MKQFRFRLLTSALLCGLIPTGQAALYAVDPGPYSAATGFFPQWYQDAHAVTLELCLSKAQSTRVPGAPGAPSYMCTLLPNPGIFNDLLPIVFPTNYPDEGFYFTADAAIDAGTVPDAQGIVLGYGAAVEAAFGGGVPLAGDQTTFARIRIRADIPAGFEGTYRITHPYGVETFFNVPAGTRTINMTRDIGLGTADFTGALAGDIGPFLRSRNGPYTETNPDTGELETFIGDPNLTTDAVFPDPQNPGQTIVIPGVLGEQVTGSPFHTNYVRIERLEGGIDVTTDVFAVTGKLFATALPTPLTLERSTYSQGTLGIFDSFQTDVFALAPPTAVLEFTDALANTSPMHDFDADDGFYGYKFYGFGTTSLPAPGSTIEVTTPNPGGGTDSTSSALTDLVTIHSATYSLGSDVLTVEAASSDEINLPLLTLVGTPLPPAAGPAGVTFTMGPLTIPPATVTVISANGGTDTEAVILIP